MHRFHNHSMEEQLLRLLTLYPGRHTQSELAQLLHVTPKRFEKIWARLKSRYHTLYGTALQDYLQDVATDDRSRRYLLKRSPISFLGTLNGYDKTSKRQNGIPSDSERILSLWYALQDAGRPIRLDEWLNVYSELDERGLSRKEAISLIQQLIALQVVVKMSNGMYQATTNPIQQLSTAERLVYYVTSLHATMTTYSPTAQFMSEYFSAWGFPYVFVHSAHELPLLTASKQLMLQKLIHSQKKCALFTYRQADTPLICHILDLAEEPLTKRVYAVTDHPSASKIRLDRINQIDILREDEPPRQTSHNKHHIHLRFFSTEDDNPWILDRVCLDIKPAIRTITVSNDYTDVMIVTDDSRQYFPWVRAFGSSCEWIAPQTERDLFYQHLLEMRRRYESSRL